MDNADIEERMKSAFENGRCFLCNKKNLLEERQFIDDLKTFICTECIRIVAKEVRRVAKEGKRGMYTKLKNFLESIQQQQEQLALTFSDFAMITGSELPKTACKDKAWWANTLKSPQGKAWMLSGWKLDNIYLHAKIAVFRKKGGNPLEVIPKYVKNVLDSRSHVMPPSVHVLIGWIRFCRKIAWYFEGKVLYEQGGLTLDSLNETERSEVDEDYAVCKRELTRYKNKNP